MEIRIAMGNFLMAYSEALDQICPAVVDHHKDVAYWSGVMGVRLGMEPGRIALLVQSALLHDIGIFSLEGRMESLSFEFEMEKAHAEAGALLLGYTPYFERHSNIIRHHHDAYDEDETGYGIPLESQIIFLVDRIAVMVDKASRILVQRKAVWAMLEEQKGKKFSPELVDIFKEVLYQDDLWMDLQHRRDEAILANLGDDSVVMNDVDIQDFGKLFMRAIDFRSRYTAAHSIAVAHVAKKLSELMQYTEEQCQMMLIAGFFHDIGKVVVPSEILDKPDVVTREEMEIIREHPYYTQKILKALVGLGRYAEIAAQHHERTDGSGYPYHLKGEDIHPESMLLSIADIFTAITETRSYRSGMAREKVFQILDYYQKARALDARIIDLVKTHYDDLRDDIFRTYSEAFKEYEAFDERVEKLKT